MKSPITRLLILPGVILGLIPCLGSCSSSRHHNPGKDKPLIGISCGLSSGTIHYEDALSYSGTNTLAGAYVEAVARAGGIPLIVPSVRDTALAREILSSLDGIVFTGGEDVGPHFYGEEVIEDAGVKCNAPRDTSDFLLASLAIEGKLPVLGICRGMQLLNVALGGTLYQDLPSQRPSPTAHSQTQKGHVATHSVRIVGKSHFSGHLRRMADKNGLLPVNSSHHQAVKDLGEGVEVVCLSDKDDVIEGFCNAPSSDLGTIFAVQFHPEKFIEYGILSYVDIIRLLVDEASR